MEIFRTKNLPTCVNQGSHFFERLKFKTFSRLFEDQNGNIQYWKMQDFGQNGLYFYTFTQHGRIINMIAATKSVKFQISRPKCNFSRPNSQNSRTFKTMIKFQTFSRLFPFSLLHGNPVQYIVFS